MFHVILFAQLIFWLANPLPIPFGNSTSTIELISSKPKNDFQMVITLKGQIGQQIKLSAPALSSDHNYHILTINKESISVAPKMKDQQVIFNYKHDNQYFLALEHKIKNAALLFLSLEIQSNGIVNQLLLTGLDVKMHQMEKSKLFRCHNTLIYVEVQPDLESIHLVFFTADKKQGIWVLKGDNWSQQWRHSFQKIFYGGAHRKGIKQNVKVTLSNGYYCQFNPLNLPSFPLNKQPLTLKPFYRIEDILKQVPYFEMVKQKIQQQKPEQL